MEECHLLHDFWKTPFSDINPRILLCMPSGHNYSSMACNLHIEDFVAIPALVVNGRCSDPLCQHRDGLIGAHPRHSVGTRNFISRLFGSFTPLIFMIFDSSPPCLPALPQPRQLCDPLPVSIRLCSFLESFCCYFVHP